ncbi:hypothetical protein DH2020_000665 [Rehmannia glutinosa]|uniref:Uncharacterized protein n=1 Tax=Rehmannia glutinosa TaxID=99300 RepID=A0ABR0XXL5_REHGL
MLRRKPRGNLAQALPGRSSLAPTTLAKPLPLGIKISSLPEYDEIRGPPGALRQTLAKVDLYDMTDVPYCNAFRTTLTKRANLVRSAPSWINYWDGQAHYCLFTTIIHPKKVSIDHGSYFSSTTEGMRVTARLHEVIHGIHRYQN